MKTNRMQVGETAAGAPFELKVLCGDGSWRPLPEAWSQPVPPEVALPREMIHQLVSRVKEGPVSLETVLDAVRRQWHGAA